MAVQRHFLLRFVRLGLDVGSGLALNVAATYLTGGAAAIPLGIMMVGAAATLLAAKGTAEHHLSAAEHTNAERELTRLKDKHGSLGAALSAIVDGTESSSGFSPEMARSILELPNQSPEETGQPDDALLIYIGQWIERWCTSNDIKIEQVQQAIEDQSKLIQTAIAKIEQAAAEDKAAHETTQQLVRRVRYFVRFDLYVRPFVDQTRLFRHDWALVGREDAKDAISGFIRSGPERVGMLCGRGGIGKSKLLFAAVEHAHQQGWTGPVYFVPEHVPLREITEAELPGAGSLVVVDDAHRYEDFAALLELLNLHSPDVRVLVATRPHAFDYVKATIISAKYDVTQVRVFPTLENLSKADTKLLAEQALGPNYKYVSDQIVDSTWDCPLVTVIAGQLVARAALSPTLLERQTEFRDAVLARFQDELLGAVGDRVPPADCVQLIEVLSAVAPANPAEPRFVSLAAKFTGISEDRVQRGVAAMESAGLLLRRGDTVRIAPDVLADYVLSNACIQNGAATGFADRVFGEFFEAFPEQVLRNLAELDWRNQHGGGADTNLLERIWASLERDYKTSGFDRQLVLLKVLKGIAYLQPQHVLPFIEFSIRETSAIVTTADDRIWWRTTAGDVRRQIPNVLREIAYRFDYLAHCSDLLWKLGRNDKRPLNSYADHPIRILQDIASYQQHKSLRPHEIILERGLVWLAEADVSNHAHTPFDILAVMLEKAGHSSYSKGHAIHYSPFLVDAEVTRPIRQTVIAKLKAATSEVDPRLANQALRSLGNFLLPPHPPFGLRVPKEDEEQWKPEQQDVLASMIEAFAGSNDPVRRIQIAAALPLYIRRRKAGPEHDAIRPVLNAIATDPDLQRLRSLMEVGRIDLEDDEEYDALDWKAQAARRNAEMERVAQQLMLATPTEAYIQLVDDVRRMRAADLRADTWNLFNAIGRVDVEYGMQMARLIWADSESPLLNRSDVFLTLFRLAKPADAGSELQNVASSSSVSLRRLAAHYLGTSGCLTVPISPEIESLDRLLVDPDDIVREAAIAALYSFRSADLRGAIDRALSSNVGSSSGVARKVCDVLMQDYKTLHEAATDDDLRRALAMLLPVESIEDYHIAQFINEAALRLPSEVVEFAIARVNHASGKMEYHALPHGAEIFDANSLAKEPTYRTLLRRVRDELLAKDASSFWLPKLYAYISGHFSQPGSLDVLTEALEARDADQLKAVLTILREAGRAFVFDHRKTVEQMLDRAFDLGEDCFESVRSDLYASAVYGERHGTAGQPFPEDIQLRDRSNEMLKTCSAGSRLHTFYEMIRKTAMENIRRALSEGEVNEE